MVDKEKQTPIWERHAQTIMMAVTIGVMGWVGVSVTDSRETIARLEERISSAALREDERYRHLLEKVANLSDQLDKASDNYYTANEAKRDADFNRRERQALEARIVNIEQMHYSQPAQEAHK